MKVIVLIYISDISNIEEFISIIKEKSFLARILCRIIKSKKLKNIIKKIVYKIYLRKKFYYIKEDTILMYGIKVNLINIIYNKRNLDKLILELSKKNVKNIVLSKKLKENKELINKLREKNIRVIDGRILYEVLIESMVDYIFKVQNANIHDSQITFLIKQNTKQRENTIEELTKKFKITNIVSDNKSKFTSLRNRLKLDYGIILNVVENAVNVVKNSDIIINYDTEEIKDLAFKKGSIIINIDSKEKIDSNYFSGINIRDYEIYIPDENRDFYKKYQNKFDISNIYESICVYEGLTMNEIKKKSIFDNLSIKYFIGNYGKISGRELINIIVNKYYEKA